MPHVTVNLLMLMIGGAMGTLARFGVMKLVAWAHPLPGEEYPLYVSGSGTLIVNAVGCFFFGIIWAYLTEVKSGWSPIGMIAILTGFMGAFTTFSTFAFEAEQLYKHHGLWSAGGYWLLQNVAGLVLVCVGIWLGKVLAEDYLAAAG